MRGVRWRRDRWAPVYRADIIIKQSDTEETERVSWVRSLFPVGQWQLLKRITSSTTMFPTQYIAPFAENLFGQCKVQFTSNPTIQSKYYNADPIYSSWLETVTDQKDSREWLFLFRHPFWMIGASPVGKLTDQSDLFSFVPRCPIRFDRHVHEPSEVIGWCNPLLN